MISGHEDLRNGHSSEFCRPRVDRGREQGILKRIGKSTFRISKSTREQPDNGIGNGHRRDFSTGEDIVTDGKFAADQRLPHPVIHSLIMSAKKDQIFLQGKLVGMLLLIGNSV